MPILRFKNFEDLDRFERKGKGINWQFTPGKDYLYKALKFRINVPFNPGVYKFKTFEEAQIWERRWWVEHGNPKRTR